MKKIYLFILFLASTLSVFAQNKLLQPEFTAEGTPDAQAKWYYMQFRNSKLVVSVEEADLAKLKYISSDLEVNKHRQFKFVGDETNFKIVSKSGKPLVYVPMRGMFITSETDSRGNPVLSDFELFTDGTNLEVVAKNNVAINGKPWTGEGKGMNQFQGGNNNGGISTWDSGDSGNQLDFIPVEDEKYYFSTERNPELNAEFNPNAILWYKLIFNRGNIRTGYAMQDMGEGQVLQIKNKKLLRNDELNSQLWQLVGTDIASGFKIVNKNGQYVYIDGNSLKLSPTDRGDLFTIEDMPNQNGQYPYFLQIKALTKTSGHIYVNPAGGTSDGKSMGFWQAGDAGNAVYFDRVPFIPSVAVTKNVLHGKDSEVVIEGLNADGKIKKGSKVTLKVARDENSTHAIKSIKINGVAIEDEVILKKEFTKELTITEDTNIEVDFFYPSMLTVKGVDDMTEVEHGTVTLENVVSSGGVTYWAKPNAEVIIKAVPEAGYELASVRIARYNMSYELETVQDVTTELKYTVGEGTYSYPFDEVFILVTFKKAEPKVIKHAVNLLLTGFAQMAQNDIKLIGVDNEGKAVEGEKVTLDINLSNPQYLINYIKIDGVAVEKDFFEVSSYQKELTITKETNIEVSLFAPPILMLYGNTDYDPITNGSLEILNSKQVEIGGLNYTFARPNSEVKFIPHPEAGYELKSLKVFNTAGKELADITDTKTFNVKGGLTEAATTQARPEMYLIVATFSKIITKYTVEVLAPAVDGGAVEVVGGNTFAENTEVTVNVTTKEGYNFVELLVDGEAQVVENGSYTFRITKNTQLQAVFKKKEFVNAKFIKADIDGGKVLFNKVEISENMTLPKNEAIQFTSELKEGFAFAGAFIDGKFISATKNVLTLILTKEVTIQPVFVSMTALEELAMFGVKVYPNPATDKVNLEGFMPNAEVHIINMLGVTVKTIRTDVMGMAQINVTTFPRGLYIIKSANKVTRIQLR